jgi:predicted PurR-regulated permease PerM
VRGRATLAAALSTAIWVSILVVPSIMVVGQLVNEARDLWPRLSQQLGGSATFQDMTAWIEQSPFRRVVDLAFEVPDDAAPVVLEQRLKAGVDAVTDYIVQHVREFTIGAPGAFVKMGLTLVIFFFFLREGPRWAQRLRDALPLPPLESAALIDTVGKTVNSVFRGVLLTAAAQAVLAFIGFAVAGAPVPVILGFLTFFTALLPFVGAAAVWVPTAIGLYISGEVRAGIGLALYGTLVVSLVDNFLRPYFIGRGMRLPLLWLFLAIIGGLQSFGFLGLLLGPAALSLFLACYRIYIQERRASFAPVSGSFPTPHH